MTLLENFPQGYTPSPKQYDLVNKIDLAFRKGHKFVIVCAPTGTGKSFLAKTLANATHGPDKKFVDLIESNAAFEADRYGDFVKKEECATLPPFGAFVLTITKGLQDQYKSLFDDSEMLKGKKNYICNVDDRYDVDIAPCIFDKKLKDNCILNNKCAYYLQRKKMLLDQFGVLNYSMFLSLPDHVKNKEYIVCDEASEIEDELVKRFSRSLNYKVLSKLGHRKNEIPMDNYSEFRIWLDTVNDSLRKEVDKIKQDMKKCKGTIPLADSNRYTLYNNILMQLESTVETWESCEYIIESTPEELTLKPFKVDRLASHIFDRAERVLLMSATIIDHKTFAKTLGIKSFEYIEVESDFDPAKAPIYIDTKNKLNYKNLREKLPELTEEIRKICEHHKNDKGIIHTHTMQINEYLREILGDNPRFLFRTPGTSNESIIKQHIESPLATILVSPSLSYGVDLKGDLAKFQIVAKASYLPLGDQRIKQLFKEDPAWYQNKMLNNLIQACGRGVRNADDVCDTYILDASIYECIMKNRSKLSRYFISRFV